MSLNVLMTPFQVREIIGSIFPAAQYRGVVEGDSFSLEVILPHTQPIRFSKALDGIQLVPALKSHASQVHIHKTVNLPAITFNPGKFALVPRLAEWQKFQRATYEASGRKCIDTLISYLRAVEEVASLATLQELGLAPGQIGERYTENDLAYFRILMQTLPTMPPRTSERIFANFQRHYPAISQELLRQMKIAEDAMPIDDPRQTLLDRLIARVMGQNAAAELLATTLVSQQRQARNAKFLFVGPTGVGKTEMAKAVASMKENRFIVLAMNQYQDEHSGSNLFGASTGFLGSDDKPHFAKAIESYKPAEIGNKSGKKIYRVKDVVILFDELEKAHHRVKQSLLTLLDEGYVEVHVTVRDEMFGPSKNMTIRYVFNSSIFIGTSNLYQTQILEAFRRGDRSTVIADRFKTLNTEMPIPSSFSPEFLGRLTVIPFGPIPRGRVYQSLIQSKMRTALPALKEETHCHSIEVEEEPRVLTVLEGQHYGEGVDIRRVEKYFHETLKNFIYAQTPLWKGLEGKKLVIMPMEGDRLGIRVLRVLYGTSVEWHPIKPIAEDAEPDLR